jgi:uncharacterized protein
MFTTIKKVWLIILAIPFLFSCATYNQKLTGYYQNLQAGNYTAAETELKGNKFLKKKT